MRTCASVRKTLLFLDTLLTGHRNVCNFFLPDMRCVVVRARSEHPPKTSASPQGFSPASVGCGMPDPNAISIRLHSYEAEKQRTHLFVRGKHQRKYDFFGLIAQIQYAVPVTYRVE